MMINDPEMVAAHLTAAIVHGRVVGDRSSMNKIVTVEDTVKTYLECLEELRKPHKPDGGPLERAFS